MRSNGTIAIPDERNKGKYTVCHFRVEHLEKPDGERGIDGGKIIGLTIRADGTVLAAYDRGWEVKPDEDNLTVQSAYAIMILQFN